MAFMADNFTPAEQDCINANKRVRQSETRLDKDRRIFRDALTRALNDGTTQYRLAKITGRTQSTIKKITRETT